MATRAQKAAARRNIKKAQAALRRKRHGRGKRKNHPKRKRAAAAANANPRRRHPKRKRAAAAANANPRRRHPKRRRAAAAAAANANPRRRHPKRRRAAAAANANPRRPRRRAAAANANPRRRKGSHRANPSGGSTVVNVNPWYGQPRRHSKAAKKGWHGRRRAHGAHRRRTTKRCKPCRPRRNKAGKFTGGFKRNDLAALNNPHGTLSNPPALYANAGIGSMATWANFGTAAVATAFGLVVADFVDRVVATRQPADTATTKGVRPWYGRDAAAAQRMRPDAWRLGVQAGGAVIALALAFWTRNIKFLPWALSGVALGFASTLIMKLTTWWLMPAILKVQKPGEQTMANRTYVLEQDTTQTVVQGMFDKWDQNPALKNAQAAGDNPAILGPLDALTADQAQKLVLLGKEQANGSAPGAVGSPSAKVPTGRLGLCPFCKQVNGCLSNCPSLCPKCSEYRPFIKAKYPVKAGDNLTKLAQLGAVNISDINAMNGGGSPETYWQVGKTALVPYGVAMVIEQRDKASTVGGPPQAPQPPAPAVEQQVESPAVAPEQVIAKPKTVSLQNLGVAEDVQAE